MKLSRLVAGAGAMLMLMLMWGVPVNADVVMVPGVHAGDWAKYDLTYNYTTDDPKPPSMWPVSVLLEREYITVEVLSVSGVDIESRNTLHYKNGTEYIHVDVSDVSVGPVLFFIAANLSTGDSLLNTPYSRIINATLTHSYAGAEREVNYVGFDQDGTHFPYGYRNVGDTHIYWDRATGILAELTATQSYIHVAEGYVTQMLFQCIISETNIWRPDAATVGDLNNDQKVDIADVAIAASAFGSFPGHPRWNPIADLNEDDKIDLKDVLVIARNFGKTNF